MDERIAVVSACKYVDMVISDAPLTVTKKYIKGHNITTLVTSSNRTPDKIKLMYPEPNEMYIIKVVPHTENISTTDIIKSVLKKIIFDFILLVKF